MRHEGMSYDAMQACADRMNREYRAGRTERAAWLLGISSLHSAYVRTNDYSACVCHVCREVRLALSSKGII